MLLSYQYLGVGFVNVIRRKFALWAVFSALAAAGQSVPGRPAVPAQNPAPDQPPSISLSPAVVMAKGTFGQGLTQTLALSPAGETEHSIASSAVFSQQTIIIKAFTTGTVDVRLTIPPETKIRAVVAMFRGTNKLPTSNSSVGMTASLGALLTFNLTENVKLDPEPVQVKPANETSNLVVSQWISNNGTEPVLPEGMTVILNGSGALVGKSAFSPQRLLPGERLEFLAEYPEPLPAGQNKALSSFQFEGKTLTSDATFRVQ